MSILRNTVVGALIWLLMAGPVLGQDIWPDAGGGGSGSGATIGMTSNGYLTSAGVQAIWNGAQPNPTRPGGWSEYYFSTDQVGIGDITTVGNDANACTVAAPCLTKTKMLAMMKPGAKIIIDAGDDWTLASVDTTTFLINIGTVGCPLNGTDICVWFTTTAADKSITKAQWGNTVGSALTTGCFAVQSSTGAATDVPRSWIFVEGLGITCDASNAAGNNADVFASTGMGAKVWFHNVWGLVQAADASDNCITAHAGSLTVVTGNPAPQTSLCRTGAAGAASSNPTMAQNGGSDMVVISRGTIENLDGTTNTNTQVIANGCGANCTTDANNNSPTTILIGPHVTCTACTNLQIMLEDNPDPVNNTTTTATTMAIYTSMAHNLGATGDDSGLYRAVLTGAPIGTSLTQTRFIGYRNSWMTGTHVLKILNNQIDNEPNNVGYFTDIGSIYDTPEGGTPGNGAILHIADTGWKTAYNVTLRNFVYDNNDGGGGIDQQCYLEDGGADVNDTTPAACMTDIGLASGVTTTWSLDNSATLAANQVQSLAGSSTIPLGACSPTRECKSLVTYAFSTSFPDNIVLPDAFGLPITGVALGSSTVPTDAGRL